MKKIKSIQIKMIDDYDPDLSYLGEYSSIPKNGAIDREEIGDMGRGEYRYFNPGNYDPSDKNCDKYALEDYKRMEVYNDGDWGCVIISANCIYLISLDNGKTWIIQDIGSGGLGGIESDAEREYFIEVAEEELSTLIEYLKEIGFTEEEIIPYVEKAINKFKEDI
jgi:hypothetical protein